MTSWVGEPSGELVNTDLIHLGSRTISSYTYASDHDDTIILGDFNLQIDWVTMKASNSASLSFLNYFST